MFSPINIISWNIRGLNNSIAARNLRDHIRENRVGIFCVQETKSEKHPGSFLNLDGYETSFQPSEGLSGGLVTGCKVSLFKCIALAQSKSWIWNCFINLTYKSRLNVVNIYSPLQLDKKEIVVG